MPWTAREAARNEKFAATPPAAGREGEECEAGEQHAAPAEEVAGSSTQDEQPTECQRVRSDHPLRRRRAYAELDAERGQRDVDDAEVEDDDQRRPEHDTQAETSEFRRSHRMRVR